jgi:hypothetical protein
MTRVRRSLAEHCAAYDNSWIGNWRAFRRFNQDVNATPWLASHRRWVEQHRHGYGHRAFHALFLALIEQLASRVEPIRLLEIGVFKGQTVSLAALSAKQLQARIEITAVSPLLGNLPPLAASQRAWRWLTDPGFRRQGTLGNLHPGTDHLADIRRIYEAFELDFGALRVVRGRSQEPEIAKRLQAERFALVFIDGDHSYEAVRFDIETYTPLVVPGGYAVLDDAAYFLPGFGYSKGFKQVSVACRALEASTEFRNVINVGKMRVFERLGV